jgi:hypothetical protein
MWVGDQVKMVECVRSKLYSLRREHLAHIDSLGVV